MYAFKWLCCGFLILFGGVGNAAPSEDCTIVSNEMIRVVPKESLEPHELAQANCRKVKKKSRMRKKPMYQRPSNPKYNPRIPRQNIGSAVGGSEKNLSPDKVTLGGAQKNFKFSTPVGNLQIRWQVKSTPFFGREPYFLVKQAWIDAARSLARRSFPVGLRSKKFDWKLVFLDKAATTRTYPWGAGDCHPAWIRPPANIFVSAYYIGTGCGRKKLPESKARERLTGTLYHEFGHAVEYQLLGVNRRGRERYHSEGFAMWFEAVALADHGKSAEAGRMRSAAKKYYDVNWDPSRFNGSYPDYVRAFAMIETIVEKRNLRKLMKIYELLKKDSRGAMRFGDAVQKEIGWDLATWKKQTSQYLGKG